MDIPFEGQFNGYGVNPGAQAAAPAVDASAAANRAARVGKFGAATVDAMEAAGRAPANMSAPNLVTPPTATGVSAAPRFAVPSWLKTAGGFGAKLMRGFGVAGGLSAAAEYGGPLLESAFKFGADKIAGATGSNMSPNPAVQAAQPAVAPVAAAPAPHVSQWDENMGEVDVGQKNLVTAMAPGFGAPTIAANALSTGVTPPGTGGVRNNQTGQVTGIAPSGYGAAPARDYTGGNAAASFFQAGAFLKNTADDNALAIARAKANSDAQAKGAEAGKHIAETRNLGIRSLAGVELAKTGDYGAAAAAAGGRSAGTGNVFHEMATAPPDVRTGALSILNGRTGAITKTVPTQKVSAADFEAAKKQHPSKTAAEIITGFRNQGHDVSGLKP